MKARRFNWQLWLALVLCPIAFLSYPFVFERWPLTRDVPWVNLLIFAVAAVLLWRGVVRGFVPGRLRALRVSVAVMVAALSFGILASFVQTVFVLARNLPPSANAPRVGERVPDFVLPDEMGRPVSLADLIHADTQGIDGPGVRGVLLIFSMYAGCRAFNSEYRGIQQHLEELRAAGVRPVVISIDTPEVSRTLSEEAGYSFTFLSDPTLEVIRRYDVAHGDMARPAEFLVDTDSIVRWRNLTSSVFVRARPSQILQAASALR